MQLNSVEDFRSLTGISFRQQNHPWKPQEIIPSEF